MAGVSWKDRGKVMDECVDAGAQRMDGRTVRVPWPHGARDAASVHAAAPDAHVGRHVEGRRATRRALRASGLAGANMPELETVYNEECAKLGKQGFISMPPAGFHHIWIADDPTRRGTRSASTCSTKQ
jgi:hypothetical protein